MDDTPDNPEHMRGLRLLRWLVTGLTATMMAGLIVLIWLFVTRFPERTAVPLPETLTLPDGTTVTAFTRAANWFAVVTDDERILILDAATGALRQTIRIQTAQ